MTEAWVVTEGSDQGWWVVSGHLDKQDALLRAEELKCGIEHDLAYHSKEDRLTWFNREEPWFRITVEKVTLG